jgi:hypothetical protein
MGLKEKIVLAQELNQFETPKYHEKKVAAIPGA